MSCTGISNMLRNVGIRPTPQRIAIYKVLNKTTQHPTAELIYEAVKDDFPSLSFNTVYDTLRVFTDAGIIRKLSMRENISRYDANPIPHGHFICINCGCVDDLGPIVDKELDKIDVIIRDKINKKVIDRDYRFYGYCSECERKMQSGEEK